MELVLVVGTRVHTQSATPSSQVASAARTLTPSSLEAEQVAWADRELWSQNPERLRVWVLER